MDIAEWLRGLGPGSICLGFRSSPSARLYAVYRAWNKANGLNLGSANEHLADQNLQHEQRKWLETFSRLWSLSNLTS